MADELKVRHASPDADPRPSARPRGVSPRPDLMRRWLTKGTRRSFVSSSPRLPDARVRLSALASARLDARS